MRCLKGCFLCCLETEMILSEDDIRRIESLGYDRSEFSEFRNGFIRLKNVNGACFFLKNGRCVIYELRPAGCRAYPVVLRADDLSCTLDDLCPANHTVEPDEFKESCRSLKDLARSIGLL